MEEKNISFISSDQRTKINATIFMPKGKIIGIIQILHGMSDRIGRYDETAGFFTDQGYLVCGHDFIGHGLTMTEETKGVISGSKGYLNLIDDTFLMQKEIKKLYPDLPYFLLGHSLGAAVAKGFASKYGHTINGLILSGTGDKARGINFAIMYTKKWIKKKGELAKAYEVDKTLFGNINDKFKPANTVSDWLSRDEEKVQRFVNDPLCCFLFTNIGYLNMFYLFKHVGSNKNIKAIPKELPVLIFTGNDDVSAKLGKSTKKFYERLKKYKMLDVSLRIYEGGRHEMLNETNREEVYADISNWLKTKKSE